MSTYLKGYINTFFIYLLSILFAEVSVRAKSFLDFHRTIFRTWATVTCIDPVGRILKAHTINDISKIPSINTCIHGAHLDDKKHKHWKFRKKNSNTSNFARKFFLVTMNTKKIQNSEQHTTKNQFLIHHTRYLVGPRKQAVTLSFPT